MECDDREGTKIIFSADVAAAASAVASAATADDDDSDNDADVVLLEGERDLFVVVLALVVGVY